MDDTKHLDLETILLRVGTLAAAVAGTVGFLYAVGGAVMWLRFSRAQLPADQALALVPRTDLLVIGLRVLILPALAAGGLFVLLAKRRCGSARGGSIGPRALAVLVVTVLGLVLVVPAAPGAYAWPVAALALWYVWVRGLATPTGNLSRRLVWRAAVAAMLAAALISIARQLDHPVKLPSATVTLAGAGEVTGVLVSVGHDDVVVGLPEERRLASYPRRDVESIAIGSALDRRAPARSLLSKVLGGDAWAATPLEVWCGGESYSWIDVDDLCKTQPTVVEGGNDYRDDRLRVSVECPRRADDGCSGFLTVTTRDTFRVDDLARAQPLEIGRVAFRIKSGETLPVAMPVSGTLERCLRTVRQPLHLRAVLSSDRAALGPLNDRLDQRIAVRFDHVLEGAEPRDCTAHARDGAGGNGGGSTGEDGDGESTGNDGGSTGDDGGSSGDDGTDGGSSGTDGESSGEDGGSTGDDGGSSGDGGESTGDGEESTSDGQSPVGGEAPAAPPPEDTVRIPDEVAAE
jgi:hypothetical protein